MKIKINKIFGKYNNEIDFDNRINIFIGENGIGKSTTINILKCLLEFRYIKLQDYYFESIEIIDENDSVFITYDDLCLSKDYIYNKYKEIDESNEVLDMLTSFLNELDYRLLYKINKNFSLLYNERQLRYFVNNGFLDYIRKYIENIYLNSEIIADNGYFYKNSNIVNLHEKIKILINKLGFNNVLFLKLSNDFNVINLFENNLEEEKKTEQKINRLLEYVSNDNRYKKYLSKSYIEELKTKYNISVEKETLFSKFNISNFLFTNIYTSEDLENFKNLFYDFIYENLENIDNLPLMYDINEKEYNKILLYLKPLIPKNNILYDKLNEVYNDTSFKYGNEYKLLCYFIDKFGDKYLNIKNDKLDKLNNLFKKYFNNKEVIATPFGISISTNDYKNDIYFEELSEGEKKIIILFTAIIFADNMIVLMDEPETSLSAVWQKDLIKDTISCNYNRLIIATQSPYIVSRDEYLDYLVCLPLENSHE